MTRDAHKNSTEVKFLITLGVVVGLFAIPTLHSILKVPPPEITGGVLVSARVPASSPIPAKIDPVPEEVSVSVSWPCGLDPSAIEVSQKMVRLKSSTCLREISKIAIKNKTNGFTASVFPKKEASQFTTDYVDLAVGENQIELDAVNEQGQLIKKSVTIKRRQPASPKE